MIRKILYEPLLHFLLLGAVLYVYFDHSPKNNIVTKKQKITLLEYDLSNLSRQTHLKDHTLLLNYLKYQKTLLTDAYSLELYKDDKIIQTILFKKMEFILQSNAKIKEPSEEDLQKYYKHNQKDFSKLLGFDLYIKEFNVNVDKKFIEKLIIISDINNTENIHSFKNTNLEKITQKFGKYFALQIASVAQDSWSKPFRVNNKIYIVYITNKRVGEVYPFESIEGRVYKQYKRIKTRKAIKKEYKDLLKNYIIKVQK